MGFTQKQTQRPRFMLKYFIGKNSWDEKIRECVVSGGDLMKNRRLIRGAAPSTSSPRPAQNTWGRAGGHEPRQVSELGCL